MVFRARHWRFGLLLGTAFVGGIAVGPGLGSLSSAFAQDSSRTDMYQMLKVFGDVMQRVRSEYVDPVDDKDLVENAINGMLTGLDPHSSYMNAKAFRDMQVQTKGEFGGLGIEVNEDKGIIKVVSPIDDTPAARAGIKPGDIITALDGKTLIGDDLERCGGPDARTAEFQDRADLEAAECGQAGRGFAGPRGHSHSGRQIANGAKRYRLCPAVAIH